MLKNNITAPALWLNSNVLAMDYYEYILVFVVPFRGLGFLLLRDHVSNNVVFW
jgi:hypothetical protein